MGYSYKLNTKLQEMQVSSVLESCFTVVCVSKIVWLFLLRSCQCWLKPSHSVTSADLCGRCSCLTGLSVVACCLVLVTPWGQGSHLRGFMVMHVSHKASCCLDALKHVFEWESSMTRKLSSQSKDDFMIQKQDGTGVDFLMGSTQSHQKSSI